MPENPYQPPKEPQEPSELQWPSFELVMAYILWVGIGLAIAAMLSLSVLALLIGAVLFATQ